MPSTESSQPSSTNDEELGKEALYGFIYQGHPYGHYNTGRVAALEKLTLDGVKALPGELLAPQSRFRHCRGLWFGISATRTNAVRQPAEGTRSSPTLPRPEPIEGNQVRIIEEGGPRDRDLAGLSDRNHAQSQRLGRPVPGPVLFRPAPLQQYPLPATARTPGTELRRLCVHRVFPRGMFQFHPDPNLGRRQQIFQIWIRPLEPQNARFALQTAVYELAKLSRKG